MEKVAGRGVERFPEDGRRTSRFKDVTSKVLDDCVDGLFRIQECPGIECESHGVWIGEFRTEVDNIHRPFLKNT